MNFTFQKGITSDNDLEKICLLDSLIYDEKYLLDFNDYKDRLSKNENLLFTIKKNKEEVVAYTSFVPIDYDCYIKLRNGEIDKEVINVDNILSDTEKKTFYYFDSIIVDSKYRNNKLGRRLLEFALNDIISNRSHSISIIAHAVTKPGKILAKGSGFKTIKMIDNTTIIMEKTIK